ncbi:MAG: hypothetical protein B9S33_02205 [Pedosphaera sp. Tous-C6FEB]|nr:MAG: hypothetical protein B9S33_02205 [Pedosphaera sp. Tous-C6FEB]
MAGRHPGTATLLLEAGASARSRLPNGYPLVFMATSMGDTNLLAHFEAHGAKLNEREPRFLSSLMHYAATSEMLQFLIGRGQSVNATNRLGATPLHLAAGGGRLDLLQVLATNGAKLTHLTARGHTALDEARYALARNPSSNAAAVVTWLEAFAATNPSPAKPLP